MRGSKFLFMQASIQDGQEKAHQKYKEECEQRLAKIQNGADPKHKNGPWPGQKPGEIKH